VDVDEVDAIASKYNVSMMPTFVVFKNKEKHDSMCGSNSNKLEQFTRKHVQVLSSETTNKKIQ
jgi:thioredoxin-like negative regulator of GroEL